MPYRQKSLTKSQVLKILDDIYAVTGDNEALLAKDNLSLFEGIIKRILTNRGEDYLNLRRRDSAFPNSIDKRWRKLYDKSECTDH